MTLMMTSAQVVETSANVTNNSPSRDYSHPDDQTTQTTETPGFKPFTNFIQFVILENLSDLDFGLCHKAEEFLVNIQLETITPFKECLEKQW